jgi:hypothetical protein
MTCDLNVIVISIKIRMQQRTCNCSDHNSK